MNSLHPTREMSSLAPDAVTYTMSSLVTHVDQCERDRSPWFGLQTMAEQLHALISPRLVTSGAVVAVCFLALMSVA